MSLSERKQISPLETNGAITDHIHTDSGNHKRIKMLPEVISLSPVRRDNLGKFPQAISVYRLHSPWCVGPHAIGIDFKAGRNGGIATEIGEFNFIQQLELDGTLISVPVNAWYVHPGIWEGQVVGDSPCNVSTNPNHQQTLNFNPNY